MNNATTPKLMRLLCRCGKPLDRLDANGSPLRQRPSLVGEGAIGPPASARYAQVASRPKTTPRYTWRCRRCMAPVTLRDMTLVDAAERCRSEGRDHVVVGLDV